MARGLLHACTLLLLAAAPASGQAGVSDTNAGPLCELGPISYVFIDNHSIFDTSADSQRRFSWFYRAANATHVRTRRATISRELLFGAGDCYDPVLAEESERLLRASGYLAQVDIFGVPQPDGSYHVVVDTRDEWSTQADVRFGLRQGVDFEGVGLREANLLGRGESVSAYYIERDVTRDYGIAYETPQLAGTRWDLRGEVGRTRAGTTFSQMIAYPFIGEVGRWAARQEFSRVDRFFNYVVSNDDPLRVLVPVRDKHFDMAVVSRLGHRGNLTLLGGGISYQELSYPGATLVARNDEVGSVATDSPLFVPALADREALKSFRLGLLLGQRNVWWVKRRGLDSMRGEQDVRLGTEVGVALARSLPFQNADDDLHTTLSAFAGYELGQIIITARGRADGRRDLAAPATQTGWKDLFAEGEVLGYWRPAQLSRHTLVLRASGTGGWNTRTPFQLTLGGDRNLRGYQPDRFPGGHRAVFTLEDRVYVGWPWGESIDLGGTAFIDVGRMWPGDAPYGADSGWRTTAGLGLRSSFPAGSRTTYRIDVAFPVNRGPMNGLRLMISVGELLGMSASQNDWQIMRSRYEGMTGQLFRFRP